MYLHRMTTSGATTLHCGQCDNLAAPLKVVGQDAICTHCGDVKLISHDIAPHLDSNESAVVTLEGFLGYITAPQI